LGIVAILLGIVFEKQNVAYIVALTFSVAASTNFPVLVMSMFWKGLTTKGAVAGGVLGMVSVIAMIVTGPVVWKTILGNPAPIFPYEFPAIFSMPIAFIGCWLFSILDTSAQAKAEKDSFEAQLVRSETGLGAEGASSH
jgi:cation/acetate symporter